MSALYPRRAALFGSIALLIGWPPTDASAQDIDAAASLRGLPLPAAYYEQVRADPTAYQFSRALFARSAPGRAAAPGPVRLPVVLALFADSPTPHITRETVQASLFDGPSPYGTVTDAYLEMSRGALEVGGDVLPWVRTSWTVAQVVGASDGLGNDGMVGAYFREALDSLDATVDFADYDSDGPDGIANSGDDDGFVDVITFEYLEVAASCGGPAIWPHRWTLGARLGAPYRTNDVGAGGDTIRINDYITQGATDCTGNGVQGAGTLAHEFGHALGLPDYYHWIDRNAGAQGRRWVLGCWELMAAGSWGCGPTVDATGTFGPTHFTAPLKQQLGWLDYMEIGEVWNQVVNLDAVTNGTALRIPMGDEGTEFLIAEYRPAMGFDAQLPAGGVLFYKQDLNASRQPDPSSGAPYYLTLLERDGNRGLLRMHAEGGNRGEAGDAWAVAGPGGADLHAESTPALRLSHGSATPVTIHDVSIVNDRARLVVSTSRTPRLFVQSGSAPGTLSLRVAGGIMPYAVAAVAAFDVSHTLLGDDLLVTTSLPGAFAWVDAVVAVRDAEGTASQPIFISESGAVTWVPEAADLAAHFTDGSDSSITLAKAEYLDLVGNANGAYDVGDLRTWLRTNAH